VGVGLISDYIRPQPPCRTAPRSFPPRGGGAEGDGGVAPAPSKNQEGGLRRAGAEPLHPLSFSGGEYPQDAGQAEPVRRRGSAPQPVCFIRASLQNNRLLSHYYLVRASTSI